MVWGVAIPLAAAERVQAWLDARPRGPSSPPPRVARILIASAVLAGIGFYVVGPAFLTTDRAERQARLKKLAPAFPLQDPKALSPLAARLRGHVVMLARTIGERGAFQPKSQARARDYVLGQFARAGYSPKRRAYQAKWLASIRTARSSKRQAVWRPRRQTRKRLVVGIMIPPPGPPPPTTTPAASPSDRRAC